MNVINNKIKKFIIFFPKDSESVFNKESTRTFGGATVQMFSLIRELANYSSNIETISVIPEYEKINFDNQDKHNLVMAYNEKDSVIKKIFKNIRFLFQVRPDVVIQQGLTNPSILLSLFCYFTKSKFVFMFAHDNEAEGKFQRNNKKCLFFNLLLRFTPLLVVQNQFQLDKILQLHPRMGRKLLLMYNGFPYKSRREKISKSVLWVARCERWKRPELFIKLAEMNSDLHFTMICSHASDEEYYNSIKKKAVAVNNLNFIEFVNFYDVDAYFEHAGIFINTSEYEGYPQVFIHAVMNSVPIVSLKVNPDDFITSFECGLVCNDDFKKLNSQINRLLDDRNLYRKLSNNSYEYYSSYHNLEKNISILLENINQVNSNETFRQ